MKFTAIAVLLFVVWQTLNTVGTVDRISAARATALCSTDSECAKLCPKFDRTCDGGPEGGRQ